MHFCPDEAFALVAAIPALSWLVRQLRCGFCREHFGDGF
jgi:hypothetical protein